MKFRNKPSVIDAFQMTLERRQDNKDWPEWLNQAWNKSPAEAGAVYPSTIPFSDGTDELCIQTTEGEQKLSFGDWIVKTEDDRLYPIADDIFAATFEAVDEGAEEEGTA